MKKVLIITIIVLLCVLCYFGIANGIQMGDIEILSLKQISERNKNTDEQIEKASRLVETDYAKSMKDLKQKQQDVKQAKQKYTDIASISTESELSQANQQTAYEIEYLWTTIGNYAKKHGVVIKMDRTNSAKTLGNQPLFNLSFTVTGQYIGIMDFIYALENDSYLSFRISNFKMSPGASTIELQSTFTVNDIPINLPAVSGSSSSNMNSNTQNTNTQNNTTDTDNSVNNQTTNTVQ